MRPKPDQPLDLKTLKVWKITSAFGSVFYGLLPLIYWGASRIWTFLPVWPTYALAVLAFLFALINIFIIQKLQWNRWRYKIYENEIELMYGVFILRRVIIPMIRVQHVDTKQGPLLRHYRLASVTISTAATVHEIPGLTLEKADMLRDHIAQLAREADPDE
ncbi:PH domain-containing protein [Salipaludibacillus agaradhaerens]|uniref:PH domain-containing protein n=1 Tax=Salipaludibacillus agaradhaerens TaxID=76935 RepID=UPI00215195A8|nr:PH domain-containing protein [Salipaludibacillus agaradhaerens]MCR6106636.1 PH domain-containing protein [Salipaludibacillus agaradhaerens]MCR6118669.1 PH domain-containing protein [Salipaludibacillus agaradhaerens]UJW57750.1 PH domain-containing protein [Bacillus sp. A116_S68]